jgi:hypothetical protein
MKNRNNSVELPDLSRESLHKLFKRHYGSFTRVADQVGTNVNVISAWFRGWAKSDNMRIESAILLEAQRLLEIEAKTEAIRNKARQAIANIQPSA